MADRSAPPAATRSSDQPPLFTTRTAPLTPGEAAALTRARNPQSVHAVLQELYRLASERQQGTDDERRYVRPRAEATSICFEKADGSA